MIKVDGSKASVHWLSSNHNNGCLTKDQAVLYIPKTPKKLGQVTRDSAEGLTPQQAFEQRYTDKSLADGDVIAEDIFVIDKKHGQDFDYDDPPRVIVHDLFNKGKLPFDALSPSYQLPNKNSEALIGYERDQHLDKIIEVIKQSQGIGTYFDIKDPIIWRFKQEEDIEEIFERLIQYRLCLYAAYTSRGKTKISIEVAVRLCQQGGIVLVTTPITDTKKSFEENINDFHFGADRNLKVAYIDSAEFAKHSVADLYHRADNGELIFVVLTVQDLRYGEDAPSSVDADTKELRAKYHALSGKVNLWIRDERHAQYGGEITSQRLANMTAEYELDLTATPYNVLDKYNWEQIVSRTLLWGLNFKEHTKLPTIRIDAVSTPLSNVSPKIAAMYSKEEGFDPRKLFVRNNENFVFESELKDIRDRMYHSPLSKKKNPLSIANDTELSAIAKNCGLWVLSEGQDGDGAADYIPDLAALLNTNSKTYFTDSYTLEKECPKNTTIGKYIEYLVKQHSRVVILTCGKFLTGTDITCLGHIVLMAKMSNIANFEQLIGRMIREYPSKDEVKMYCFAPAMEIGLVQGKMAKITAKLSGGSEYEILECIPLTEYTTEGPRKISPDTILAEVQEFFKQLSKDRLPTAQLETAMAKVDSALLEKIPNGKFKKSAPKAGVTEDNGSKVKNKLNFDPKTGKPRTKEELNKIANAVNAIQTVMVEAKWIAYSINNYDYSIVLSNPVLAKMFPEEINTIIEIVESDIDIKDMVVKNLNDKQLAYKGLAPMDVYDNIFMNNEYKKNIGLVYVNFAMAKELVGQLPENKYNKEGMIILVLNALSGTIPLLIKEKFPKARIVCAEYFEYFKDHLQRLGVESIRVYEGNDGKLYLENKMKFDAVVGNPPYQSTDEAGERKSKSTNLWSRFTQLSFELVNDDGIVALVTPSSWASNTVDINQGKIKLFKDVFVKYNPLAINTQNVDLHFPGVGSTFSYFVIEKSPNIGKTRLTSNDGTILVEDLRSYQNLPKIISKESMSIDKKFSKHMTNNTTCQGQLQGKSCLYSNNSTNEYIWPAYHTKSVADEGKTWFTNVKHPNFDKPKIIFSLSGYFCPYADNGKIGYTDMCLAYILKDGELLEAAEQVFGSKLYKFYLENNKWSGFNPKEIIRSFPILDLTREWSDNDLYSYFNLTQDEIDYVESNN